jgi:predicted oxidoreductase
MALAWRPVGRTRLTVTALGMGGAPLSGFRTSVSERYGVETLLAAYAGGVRYFDAAPRYGYDRSEHIFGQALRTARPRHPLPELGWSCPADDRSSSPARSGECNRVATQWERGQRHIFPSRPRFLCRAR